MRLSILTRLALGLTLLSGGAALAQEFSADLINLAHADDPNHGTIYVSKDKMRFEGMRPAGHANMGAMVVDLAQHKTYVLMPERKMYVETDAAGAGPQRNMQFFSIGSSADACSEWQKLTNRAEGTCKKVGAESLNGRNTTRYQVTSADGKVTDLWIDPSLHFPIKAKGSDSTGMELRNIKEGSQPASLFAIPADYQKLDMGGMIKRPQ